MVTRPRGLTLLEILIATMILAIVIGGLASVFSSSKWYVAHTRSWLTAAELGGYFLDPLQSNVSQEQWANNCLGSGNCPNQSFVTTQLAPGAYSYKYTANYTRGANSPISNLTRIKLNLTWNELSI